MNGDWVKVTGAAGQEGGAGPVGRPWGPGYWLEEPGNRYLHLMWDSSQPGAHQG